MKARAIFDAMLRPDATLISRIERVMAVYPAAKFSGSKALKAYLDYLTNTYLGAAPKITYRIGTEDSSVLYSSGYAFEIEIKVDGYQDRGKKQIDAEILSMLSHELVHVEQNKRLLNKYKKLGRAAPSVNDMIAQALLQAKEGTKEQLALYKKYLSSPSELMAWAQSAYQELARHWRNLSMADKVKRLLAGLAKTKSVQDSRYWGISKSFCVMYLELHGTPEFNRFLKYLVQT